MKEKSKIMDDFNEGVDGKLASRLRRANSEQFFTLVKMHLSFELDINTEDNDPVAEKAKIKKWSLPNFTKKPKSLMNLHQSKGPEGAASLSPEGLKQVTQLIEYLSQEQCINQEGIFRRTGKLTRQQDLKSSLYQGNPLKLDDGTYSVHDCASVLKCFLAELPEPLLTELHYPAHCQIAELCTADPNANESRLLTSIQLLLLLLPSANRILLKHLLKLLHKTATLESSNKMNCDTLATLFTPHLMCPRKLSPEALHINSQNLSGLVSFMIKKGEEMFDIPPKLATDIRAYWVNQERRLLSPKTSDLNESTSDASGTAHTVFSFVNHKLTAEAHNTEDTQAALAQLYAHIQAMPESAKKRRLVKQFNKENGQGTPRHVKQVRTKSLGESIKKHIFQKKILSNKKLIDINIGCNIGRCSSEENIYSKTHKKSLLSPKKLFSKSDDDLNSDEFLTIENENLSNSVLKSELSPKSLEENVISIENEQPDDCTSPAREVSLENSDEIDHEKVTLSATTDGEISGDDCTDSGRGVRRFNSEPLHLYSSEIDLDDTSDSTDASITVSHVQTSPTRSLVESGGCSQKNTVRETSPVARTKRWNVYGAHTSTPSNLLRRSFANSDYGLTPIVSSDKSMSPITQSTSKMPKAMQETMMTPRSRKPVMMISGSNLCNLASVSEDAGQSCSRNRMQVVSIDIEDETSDNNPVISEEQHRIKNETINKNDENRHARFQERNFVTSIDDDCATTVQPNSTSITSTFREYLLSRSVLTASPVDLSFTSRTGDFEHESESDLNVLNEESLSDSLLQCLDGHNPSSDTSGIASSSEKSANNSAEKVEENGPSPRKRGTSLQRNDSKRSIKNTDRDVLIDNIEGDSTMNSSKMKDTFQETSF